MDNELEAIDKLMEDPSIWSEEDPARRNQLEAMLKANEARLELLINVVANRDAMEAEYSRLTTPRSVSAADFNKMINEQRRQ